MSESETPTIKASGCVVWRLPVDISDPNVGEVEVLVVHRPRYDDWSFPKGKLDPGETDLECAVREVREETGMSGEIGNELEPVQYVDHKGRPKVVRYWTMNIVEGSFVANDEVDEVRWVSPREARKILSYAHDAALLDQLSEPRSA